MKVCLTNRILHKLAYVLPGGSSLRPFLHRLRGVRIGKEVWISQSVYIDELHPEMITIGSGCTIGLRTTIFSHFYWGGRRENYNYGEVVIGNDVFIGPHCVILPGVCVGEGSVIKAGTVVSTNVPPLTFWGAPPSRPLGYVTVPLTHKHTYEEFVCGLKPKRTQTAKPAEL